MATLRCCKHEVESIFCLQSSQEEACECPALTSDELILGKLDKKHRKRLLTKFYSIQ
jgi:hypothetical protein